jgi:hypothetical protein
MANNERLTKRVKKIEKWLEENEGGPTLDNMNFLLDSLRDTSTRAMQLDNMYNMQRNLMSQFFTEKEMMDDWNEWLAKQEEEKNAVQEQQTEEVSVQEEAESSEEASEAQKEEEE